MNRENKISNGNSEKILFSCLDWITYFGKLYLKTHSSSNVESTSEYKQLVKELGLKKVRGHVAFVSRKLEKLN